MRVLLLSIILIFLQNTCFAQSGTWVESEGRYGGSNITPDEGKKKALDIARSEAIKKVVGVRVSEETFRNVSEYQVGDKQSEYFDIFSRLGRSTTTGKIIDEEYYFETLVENNLPVYYVNLRGNVVEEKGEPDPGFNVNIFMQRDVYYDRGSQSKNDKLEFKIVATKDCYLYLFNILSNDSVQLIMPNAYLKDNQYIVHNEEQEFEKKIKSMGMNFTVGLSPNRISQTEALYVIALKEKVDFISGNLSKDGLSIIPTYKAAITDIMNWIIQIPVNQRAEVLTQYEIRKQ